MNNVYKFDFRILAESRVSNGSLSDRLMTSISIAEPEAEAEADTDLRDSVDPDPEIPPSNDLCADWEGSKLVQLALDCITLRPPSPSLDPPPSFKAEAFSPAAMPAPPTAFSDTISTAVKPQFTLALEELRLRS